ncbi:MAG: sigma 54-interacting transcriptional regulator [Myxococcales bacterium]|nr:sigma 54-interacting transcriptional regulator [Myxococcales bacterium]
MATLRIHVLNGNEAGKQLEPAGDVIRIGRAPSNDLCLAETHVSGEHARISVVGDRVFVEDLHSTNGTEVVRGEQRFAVDERVGCKAELTNGDQLALGAGGGGDAVLIQIGIGDEADVAHVMAKRSLAELGSSTANNAAALKTLRATNDAIGGADGLDSVLTAIADSALELVQRATHVTVVLKDSEDDGQGEGAFVPVLSRIRTDNGGQTPTEGRVPITRSVYRKVVRDRCAILAADAPSETFSSESLLGAGIRSTIGVPLWLGEEIIGVLQVDNRDRPAMFDETDVDALGVLAANASLAVANARLIRRLRDAEEQLKKENSYLRRREEKLRGQEVNIVGQSKAMKSLFEQLDKVVDTRVTVLIEGKTGTGKELIASSLHARSRRRDKLFVAQNCAALPESLLESELFGHKRGAFTGATEEKKGLFEIADGGTLFLDEVTEMPLSLQAKLLRVLQEGEVRPIGANHTRIVDVRIVAATNRTLETEVSEGRFREDLYYRLKVFPIRVPPLSERREDIPLLANFFLERYSREFGRKLNSLSQTATELLMAYDWPGNVRELENEIQRCVIQAGDEELGGPELLSPRVRKVEGVVDRAGVTKGTLKEMLEQVEKYFLVECLREHDNNKTAAAKALGITREGLHKKLKQLNIA